MTERQAILISRSEAELLCSSMREAGWNPEAKGKEVKFLHGEMVCDVELKYLPNHSVMLTFKPGVA